MFFGMGEPVCESPLAVLLESNDQDAVTSLEEIGTKDLMLYVPPTGLTLFVAVFIMGLGLMGLFIMCLKKKGPCQKCKEQKMKIPGLESDEQVSEKFYDPEEFDEEEIPDLKATQSEAFLEFDIDPKKFPDPKPTENDLDEQMQDQSDPESLLEIDFEEYPGKEEFTEEEFIDRTPMQSDSEGWLEYETTVPCDSKKFPDLKPTENDLEGIDLEQFPENEEFTEEEFSDRTPMQSDSEGWLEINTTVPWDPKKFPDPKTTENDLEGIDLEQFPENEEFTEEEFSDRTPMQSDSEGWLEYETTVPWDPKKFSENDLKEQLGDQSDPEIILESDMEEISEEEVFTGEEFFYLKPMQMDSDNQTTEEQSDPQELIVSEEESVEEEFFDLEPTQNDSETYPIDESDSQEELLVKNDPEVKEPIDSGDELIKVAMKEEDLREFCHGMLYEDVEFELDSTRTKALKQSIKAFYEHMQKKEIPSDFFEPTNVQNDQKTYQNDQKTDHNDQKPYYEQELYTDYIKFRYLTDEECLEKPE